MNNTILTKRWDNDRFGKKLVWFNVYNPSGWSISLQKPQVKMAAFWKNSFRSLEICQALATDQARLKLWQFHRWESQVFSGTVNWCQFFSSQIWQHTLCWHKTKGLALCVLWIFISTSRFLMFFRLLGKFQWFQTATWVYSGHLAPSCLEGMSSFPVAKVMEILHEIWSLQFNPWGSNSSYSNSNQFV